MGSNWWIKYLRWRESISIHQRWFILNGLYPATTFANGKVARIATFFYASGQSTDPIDIATPTTTTEVDVNAAAGGTVSVLQGINLPNSLTPTFTLSVTRGQRNFIITNGVWVAN